MISVSLVDNCKWLVSTLLDTNTIEWPNCVKKEVFEAIYFGMDIVYNILCHSYEVTKLFVP